MVAVLQGVVADWHVSPFALPQQMFAGTAQGEPLHAMIPGVHVAPPVGGVHSAGVSPAAGSKGVDASTPASFPELLELLLEEDDVLLDDSVELVELEELTVLLLLLVLEDSVVEVEVTVELAELSELLDEIDDELVVIVVLDDAWPVEALLEVAPVSFWASFVASLPASPKSPTSVTVPPQPTSTTTTHPCTQVDLSIFRLRP